MAASIGRPRATRSRPARTREPVTTPFERLEHDPLEELCLSLLFQHPELAPQASKLRVEHFKRVENRELFTYWTQDASITNIGESADPELKVHLERLLSREFPSNTDTERQDIIEDCLRRLEQRRLRDLKVEEEFRLAEASKEEFFGSGQQVLELTERIKSLFLTNLE